MTPVAAKLTHLDAGEPKRQVRQLASTSAFRNFWITSELKAKVALV
jgi:hypothetical protein